ncbi:amino acid ABC transporter ATP-binding protein [Microbacterium sp. STN6]|uniref:amino acid ABC transporter ATP-binding protein n=1 Tax=Microbacterium sp. STN6 TaxID=2995588 RepID=UPI0022608C1D|nr:amino acid ABC transporter ATP-binding protein [Microbacterium sp. STN6]MCX7521322.1 amino acid ABC transporter ATP-binding protein [Microbacterium sp. STN6]
MSPTPENASRADAPRAAPRLAVRGLHKSFGAHEVLRGIDLEVGVGRVVVLIGPSGSGKTTLLRCLNALEIADSGTVRIDELEVDFSQPVGKARITRLRRSSAMVFQHYNLFPHKTVLENIIEGPVQVQKRSVAEATAEADALLEKVGLADKRDVYPFRLSGGQQQRVGIARALALRPNVILFDEPTSALDPELVGDVLGVMQALAREGWTMVVVTHELAFARQVADEVLFLDGGEIVERGHPQQLFTEPREARTRQFLSRILNPLD